MCGRYALEADIDVLIERYKAMIADTNFNRKTEIFPTNTVPIVRDLDIRRIDQLKWGFAPSYMKNILINARAETVDIKPTFKDSFINRRCIVPATSFFEWKNIENQKVKKKIGLDELEIFSMAGLYNTFIDKEGNKYEAFTILTTSSNESMKHIHDRMPVIIRKDMEDIWLDKNNKNPAILKSFLLPWQSDVSIL